VLETANLSESLGKRVYEDNCAKCHQASGLGLGESWPAPKLKDDDIVLETDPTQLVTFVVAGPVPSPNGGADPDEVGSGRPRLRMPAWGTRLRMAEILAALNHVRTHWGNQAATIVPTSKQPPPEIRALERDLGQALQGFDMATLERVYSLNEVRPVRFVRPDDNVDFSSSLYVLKALHDWLQSVSSVNSLEREEASYAVMPDDAGVVVAYGTMALVVTEKGASGSKVYRAPFVRVYVREWQYLDPVLQVWKWDPDAGRRRAEKEKQGARFEPRWVIAFDWSRLPMPIGCAVPGQVSEKGGALPFCTPSQGASTYFADVQRILAEQNQTAPQAPHGNFWKDLTYAQFRDFEFPYRPSFPGQPDLGPDARIKLVNVGDDPAKGLVRPIDTNFIKALRDGKDVLVRVPGKEGKPDQYVSVDIARMPKDKPPMNPNDIARIEAWIARDMPEKPAARPATGSTEGSGDGPGPKVPTNDGGTGPGPIPNAPPTNLGPSDVITFADVVALIKKLGPRAPGSPHGKFWEKSYADFVDYAFDWPAMNAKIKLIEKGNGADSNLVHALKGEKLKVVDEKGAVRYEDLGRIMPPGGKGTPMPAEDVEKIKKWIDAGAPEK
jgi:mono/diheme cytochrome c family protein